jgi:hypothetical protein
VETFACAEPFDHAIVEYYRDPVFLQTALRAFGFYNLLLAMSPSQSAIRNPPFLPVNRRSVRPRYAPVRAEARTLFQFVLLSMLLHVLLVVLLGTAVVGGARRGDGLIGALVVTLRTCRNAGRDSRWHPARIRICLAPSSFGVCRAERRRPAPPEANLRPSQRPGASARFHRTNAGAERVAKCSLRKFRFQPGRHRPTLRLDLNAPIEVDKRLRRLRAACP